MKPIILSFVTIFILFGCVNSNYETITKKIQYDVNIVSPDPEYDWWIQNLVGPEREKFVDLIVDGARSGKWQAYDYFNNPITVEEVNAVFSDTMAVTMMSKEPPYEVYDTLIINNILKSDIKRIRFLEEWYVNPESLEFEKKILGIAPIAQRLDFNGIVRWQPLFWIYINEDFITKLKNN